ncbi:MAG: hypothetical protein H0T62_13675 [Parachlamydiaceae bacterium]|nr:hypothetical protein [Parachlamydiaceae bacterium]
MKYLFFQILFSFSFVVLSAETIEENHPKLKKKYAIYLTTGCEAHNYFDSPWGGCHITLTGYHHKNGDEELLNRLTQIIKNNFSLQGWRPKFIKVQKGKKNWYVIFFSLTLNKIAKQLSKEGFKKVKGPRFTKSHFHMSLPHLKDGEEAEEFALKLKEKEWFVTLVELEPSSSSFPHSRWLDYFRL